MKKFIKETIPAIIGFTAGCLVMEYRAMKSTCKILFNTIFNKQIDTEAVQKEAEKVAEKMESK